MNTTRPRILVIDDTPENLKLLIAALKIDFDLQMSTSGAQGLAYASQAAPDLILLDVIMPEMDGYETCRRLKAAPELKNIPVIFITVLAEPDEESAGLGLGAADYITKPVNVEIARKRIGNLLEREQLRKEVEVHRDHLERLVEARTEALSIAKEAAEASDRAKTAFLGTVSHELRTPLNGIFGFTELALRRVTDEKVTEYLVKLQKASQRLADVFTEILDITDIEANRLTLESNEFDLAALLEKVEQLYASEAQQKGLQFFISCPPELSTIRLIGDPMRLGQVLQGMVSNSIRFTEHGSVIVTVKKDLESGTDLSVCFNVEDTGIGISPDDQLKLFQAFVQVDGSYTRKYGGVGLGLAISRHLVTKMCGTVGVKSQQGVGSTFWFTARLQKVGHTRGVAEPSFVNPCG